MAPKFLIGSLCKDQMNAFTIWEKYRKVSDEIHILSYKKRNEVLHWEKPTDNNIELSVIFPMYNVAKYLPKCIETTTAWKAEYIEYIFVDDGSPDNCSEIVEQYAKRTRESNSSASKMVVVLLLVNMGWNTRKDIISDLSIQMIISILLCFENY